MGDHKTCFKNFASMLKPGGILIIDHRNYDYILKHGRAPKKNIYYNSQHIQKITTQIIYENNEPRQIVLNYKMDVEGDGDFTNLLKGIFGDNTSYQRYADFKPLSEEPDPAFYVHVIEKPARKLERETGGQIHIRFGE